VEGEENRLGSEQIKIKVGRVNPKRLGGGSRGRVGQKDWEVLRKDFGVKFGRKL